MTTGSANICIVLRQREISPRRVPADVGDACVASDRWVIAERQPAEAQMGGE